MLTVEVDRLPPLFVDRTRIREVLVNLLVNAARFTEKGGASIRAEGTDEGARISVSDTGMGIAADQIQSIFQEFYSRRLSALSDGDRGFGLGLAICKRFVEMHGGRIWPESQTGVGTTFTFTLPVSSPTPAEPAPSDPFGFLTRGRISFDQDRLSSVVAVGRSPSPLRVVQGHLDGFHVATANTVAAAVELIDRERPHAIIITDADTTIEADLRTALGALASTVPTIRCPICYSMDDVARRMNVRDYLVKPINGKQLEVSLARLGAPVHRVLIADDDPEVVRLIARMLRSISSSIEAVLCYGGAEAIAEARKARPDAVILDLLMPGIDGYAVIQALQGDPSLREVPVIVVTAKGLEEESTIVDRFEISRPGGLVVGEAMRCLKASLEALREPTRAERAS